MQVEVVRRYIDNLAEFHRQELARLDTKISGIDDEIIQSLIEDRLTEDDIRQLGEELSIVALYRVLELTTKQIIKARFGDQRWASDIRQLKRELARIGVDLEQVDHFQVANETRLLNNSIKHNGRVSAELARKFSSWTVDDELRGLVAAFYRLAPGVPHYLKALAKAVMR
jgi:hypothetical protein